MSLPRKLLQQQIVAAFFSGQGFCYLRRNIRFYYYYRLKVCTAIAIVAYAWLAVQ